MEGGAWQSDVFYNGHDFHKTRAPEQGASGMEGGKEPAMYNPSPMPMSKESHAYGILVVSLRSALVLVSLAAFSVMAANKESIYRDYYGTFKTIYFKFTVTFSQVHAFVGLLSMDIIVCTYAIVQVVLSLVEVASTEAFMSSPTRGGNMITFVCDLVLSYAPNGVAAAAANSLSF